MRSDSLSLLTPMRQRNPRRLKYNYRARRIWANYGKSIVERVLVSVDRDREYETPKPENGVVACLPFLDGFILDQVFACAICMVNLGMAGCFRI
ncbi:hypothetical protein LIER_44077 [Lithospermum erythrorhizon]|uniref:Uncharacterized protein n=1 Tax=Lithospermum erythrorhizon TaxID=34254 RepID=A0AAV3P870_LITER